MDEWLDSQNLYRKNTALDGTCLFRAVSELLFSYHEPDSHLKLRKECVEFMAENKSLFESKVVSVSFEEYLENLSDSKQWAGELELEAISLLYGVDFLIFKSINLGPVPATDNNFDRKLMLCFTPDNFYDAVFTKTYIEDSAFCQALVYGILYERVYQLNDVDYAVQKMLHDKSSRAQREKYLNSQATKDCGNGEFYLEETDGPVVNTKELIDIGAILFPYKVAKALDPDIYRNIEFDNWVDAVRVPRKGSFWFGNGGPLRVGVKCILKLDDSQTYQAHIQEMSPDNGPVMVFVEQLGQKMTVPFDKLEPLPRMSLKPEWTYSHKHQIINKISVTKSVCNELKQDVNKKNKVRLSKKTKDNNNALVKVNSSKYNRNVCVFGEHGGIRYEDSSFEYEEGSSREEVIIAEPDSTTPSTPQPSPGGVHYSVYNGQSPVVYTSTPPPFVWQSSSSPRSPVPVVNIMANKSIKEDFSDLPMTDLETVRFFFNLGIDYFRIGYMIWPSQQPASSSSDDITPPRSVEASTRSSSAQLEETSQQTTRERNSSSGGAAGKSAHKNAHRPPRFMKFENSEARNTSGTRYNRQEHSVDQVSSSDANQPYTPATPVVPTVVAEHTPPIPSVACQPVYSYTPYSPLIPCTPTTVDVPHYQYRPVSYYEVQEVPVEPPHAYMDTTYCPHMPEPTYPLPYAVYPHPTPYYYTN